VRPTRQFRVLIRQRNRPGQSDSSTVPRFNPPAEPASALTYQTGFLLLQKLAGNFTKRQTGRPDRAGGHGGPGGPGQGPNEE
jgi:hypothetical protein